MMRCQLIEQDKISLHLEEQKPLPACLPANLPRLIHCPFAEWTRPQDKMLATMDRVCERSVTTLMMKNGRVFLFTSALSSTNKQLKLCIFARPKGRTEQDRRSRVKIQHKKRALPLPSFLNSQQFTHLRIKVEHSVNFYSTHSFNVHFLFSQATAIFEWAGLERTGQGMQHSATQRRRAAK
ncbi:hypothetical protein Ciccas_001668 [Cichlidogyrus casuarinus]|uniref:Uncharacterized protein n=1 Tax=Cichlidogyrus casuarinus TaxID=1844966 RepID=A0ABD2QJY1_9PLAT